MATKLPFLALLLLLSVFAKAQTDLYQKATGDDLSAYNHTDNFTQWQKLSDNTIKKGKINYVYYRALICKILVNKQTGKIAHPMATIEVKAPDELSNSNSELSGFINVAGQKILSTNGKLQIVKDTIQQFFNVTLEERVFSVELSIDFSQIDNIYLTIFDNDISDVYSAKDDEKNKNKEATKEIVFPDDKKEEVTITEKQTKAVFDLIFGAGSSKDLVINDADKKQATQLLSELIKGSCKMAVVDGLNNLDVSLLGIAKVFYTSKSNCNASVKKGKYYETVRKTIAYNFSSSFQIRKATGEW